MQSATYASHLCYLDADDVDDTDVDFSGLDVRGHGDEKLGDIDGFVLNVDTGRVLHVVVDSGGWFRSRRFLLPIGHAAIVDRDNGALRVDLTKEALRQYPEFDGHRFRAFSDDDLRAFESSTAAACCPDESLESFSATTWAYDARRHYTQPLWWERRRYDRERLRPVEVLDRPGSRATEGREQITAPDRPGSNVVRGNNDVIHDRNAVRERGAAVADASPHLDGRAQPGDILGIETGGERTHVGETLEDENRRRVAALHAADDLDDDDEPRR